MGARPTSLNESTLYDEEHGDPFGMLLSGVLLFNEHSRGENGSTLTRAATMNVDSCGGFPI
jgi:hypothetical protein